MPNYNDGKIYELYNLINDDVYVGSTCEVLSRRKAKHWYQAKNKPSPVHKAMMEIGLEHWKIRLIEDFPCERKEQLNAREGHWIRERGTLNCRIAGRTQREYYKDNCEVIKQRTRDWHAENPERHRATSKAWAEANKEKVAEYKKQWQEENREMIAVKNHERYEAQKEEISARRRERVMCECGQEVGRAYLTRHKKSKTHRRIVGEIPEEVVSDSVKAHRERGITYYTKNKERINAKCRERITCECGQEVRRGDISKHRKTKKHSDQLASSQKDVEAPDGIDQE